MQAVPNKAALDETIRLRLDPSRRASWQEAAKRDHRTLSDWIRMRCEGLPASAPLTERGGQRPPAPAVPTQPAATADLIQCLYCAWGFRRVAGVHVGSRHLGMIPGTPCDHVFASRSDAAPKARPWLAYVDGHPLLRKKGGVPRRFSSATAAFAAATRAAPRRWHS
jgi:hypothetical protein